MKKIFLLFVMAFSVAVQAMAEEVTQEPAEVIGKALDALRCIHAVSYNLEVREYLDLNDSVYVDKNDFKLIECENNNDSTGLPKYISLHHDGTYDSYDGRFRLHRAWYEDFIESTDISRQSVVAIRSPFLTRR